MPRPTKDTQLDGLEKLRQIAERDPMKAVEAFFGPVFNNPPAKKDGAIVLEKQEASMRNLLPFILIGVFIIVAGVLLFAGSMYSLETRHRLGLTTG